MFTVNCTLYTSAVYTSILYTSLLYTSTLYTSALMQYSPSDVYSEYTPDSKWLTTKRRKGEGGMCMALKYCQAINHEDEPQELQAILNHPEPSVCWL